jgi:hypothetical protein
MRIIESTDRQHIGIAFDFVDGQTVVDLNDDEHIDIEFVIHQDDGTVKIGNANYIMVCVNG